MNDEYFMNLAEMISENATCDRLHVGCIITRFNYPYGYGFNDSPNDHPTCDEVGHLEIEENGKIGCKRTVHAEMNALLHCAYSGIPTEEATCYVTHYPCPDCMKALNQAGIKKVVYKHFYAHRFHNSFHEGMELVQWN
jgi:dCMP deaminase